MIDEVDTPLSYMNASECCICLETIGEHVVTKCGHYFHRKCIMEVTQRQAKCPLCRTQLNHGDDFIPIIKDMRPGVDFDEDPAVMEMLLKIIYLGDYRLATEAFWASGVQQGDEIYELPRCFHWKRHFEIFSLASRLGIDFCYMQEEALWMFGCLVKEFVNLNLNSSGYAEAWRLMAKRRWTQDAEELLHAQGTMGLGPEQREVVGRLTDCVWDAWKVRVGDY